MSFDTVSVLGLGYIGLPTAAAFAGRKVHVIGVDINSRAVETINQGNIHIVEPDLDIAVRSAVTQGYLRATIKPEPADAFLIAVPTPFKADHEPDLACVEAATRSIAAVLKRGDLVVLESTSPVGTTEFVAEILAKERPDLSFPQQRGEASDVRIAHCPERVLPGHVMRELTQNDRVIGGMTPRCAERAVELYRIFTAGNCLVTDCRTAEMCKLTENSFRDTNIAFANELSIICERLNINVWELIRLANHHPRVNILTPGPGVGGHCIAVDPWFLVHSAPAEARLIKTAREVNDGKPHLIIDKVLNLAKSQVNPVIACFGLAFKADIDDLRESPAVEITAALAATGVGRVIAVEPYVQALPAALQQKGVELASIEVALNSASIVVGLVDHRSFRELDRTLLQGKSVIDSRGMWVARRESDSNAA